MTNEIKKGDLVSFGRPNGEKTTGRVIRVNAKSVSVETLEARGTQRTHNAGGKWRVAKSLVRLVGADEGPVSKRNDAAIIADLRNIESRLSPEQLFQDGERNRAAARREERALLASQKRLVAELGRWPTTTELWGS